MQEKMYLERIEIIDIERCMEFDVNELEIFFDVKNDYIHESRQFSLLYNIELKDSKQESIFAVELLYIGDDVIYEDVNTKLKVQEVVSSLQDRIMNVIGCLLEETHIIRK